jgi:hypothetical protein
LYIDSPNGLLDNDNSRDPFLKAATPETPYIQEALEMAQKAKEVANRIAEMISSQNTGAIAALALIIRKIHSSDAIQITTEEELRAFEERYKTFLSEAREGASEADRADLETPQRNIWMAIMENRYNKSPSKNPEL